METCTHTHTKKECTPVGYESESKVRNKGDEGRRGGKKFN
jgi:hypothetical protein